MGSTTVELDFKVQAKKATSELKNINTSVKSLGDKISVTKLAFSNMLGGLAATAMSRTISSLADSVVSSFGTIIDEGARLETVTTEFETLTGSMEQAEKLIKDIGIAAARTPFEIEGLQQASKQLLAVGTNAEDVVPLLMRLGDAAAIGSGDIVGLTTAFTKINGIGKVTAETFETLINQSPVLAQALVKAAGVSGVGALRRAMEQGKVTADVLNKALVQATSEGGKAFEGMSKKSATYDGKLSNLKDTITLLAGRIGKALVPAITEVVDALTEAIAKNEEWLVQMAKSNVIEPMVAGLKELAIFLNKLDTTLLASILKKVDDIASSISRWAFIFTLGAIFTVVVKMIKTLEESLYLFRKIGKQLIWVKDKVINAGKAIQRFGSTLVGHLKNAITFISRYSAAIMDLGIIAGRISVVIATLWSKNLNENQQALLDHQKALDSESDSIGRYVLELSDAEKANQAFADSFWDTTPLMVSTMTPEKKETDDGLSKAELARIKAEENEKAKLYAETAALKMDADLNAATLRAYLSNQTKTQEMGLNEWFNANSAERLRIVTENVTEESRVRLEGIALQKDAEQIAIDELSEKMKTADDHLVESYEMKLEARVKNLKKLGDVELKAQADLDKQKLKLYTTYNKKAEQDRKAAALRVQDIEQAKDEHITASAFSALQMVGGAIAKGADTRIAIASVIGAAEATINAYTAQTLANATIPQPGGALVGAALLAKGLTNAAIILGLGAVQMATNQEGMPSMRFAEGGFVGGNSYVGDMVPIQVNSGEAVLNTSQQKNFMDLANGGGNNNNNNEALIAMANRPIIVEIEGHAIASAVRSQVEDGFVLGV